MTIINAAVLGFLNPLMQIVAGILGITAGGVLVILGLYMTVSQTQTGQQAKQTAGSAAQLGMAVAAPEAEATTLYRGGQRGPGGEPMQTRVTQRRRQGINVPVAGRRIQVRQPTVTTTSTREVLRGQAWEYAGNQQNGDNQ